MFHFFVNGKEYFEERDMKLLPFLRDVCGLTSVKDGCSEGACGTCHVLIDGKATKACVPEAFQTGRKAHYDGRRFSGGRKRRFLSVPLERQELYSAASVFPEW